jgi:hypothetical protein
VPLRASIQTCLRVVGFALCSPLGSEVPRAGRDDEVPVATRHVAGCSLRSL